MLFSDQGYYGIDLAFYQGDIRRGMYVDFEKMKAAGARFVIPKVSQFNYRDPSFSYHWPAAREAGLPRGGYHFLSQFDTGKEQARFFWSQVMNDPPEGPLVADYEAGSGGDWHRLYDFLAELQLLSSFPSHRIWIYTGYYYWIDFGPKLDYQKDWFKQFPLWEPWYTGNPANVLVPYPWTRPVMWQKGTNVVYGPDWGVYSKEIDFDILNGGAEQLHYYFGTEGPFEPPQEVNVKKYRVVWPNGVARRTAPTASSVNMGSYPYLAEVDVLEDNLPDQNDPTNINKKWVKFADGLFGASEYPDNAGTPHVRMEEVEVERYVTSATIHYNDGSSVELYPD